MTRMDQKLSISWIQLITGAFALVATVAGATFAIVNLATSSHISALQLQVITLDKRVQELQAELDTRHTASTQPSFLEHSQQPMPETESSQLTIIFVQPREGISVPQFTDIEYSVRGSLPQRYGPVLVIRDPLGQYWSWGTSATGRHSRVQIGVASDSGLQFEIGVLITNREFPLGQPTMVLPEGLLYRAITVTRR